MSSYIGVDVLVAVGDPVKHLIPKVTTEKRLHSYCDGEFMMETRHCSSLEICPVLFSQTQSNILELWIDMK
jgi:hypothetical protein